MEKFVQKLREKPERQRKRILFVTTFLVTGLVFLLWILLLIASFDTETTKGLKDDFAPFEALTKSLKDTPSIFKKGN